MTNKSDEVDLVVIKRTQEILGKYVKKPSLTEKLLKKPPFRFLHDVFNVIIRDTGCFVGLYTEDDLNSDTIKDREGKIKFLQKMIDVVKLTTNAALTVRPSKIVAGLEANKTNELLQLMGEIIDKNLNWKLAVEQVTKHKNQETTLTGETKKLKSVEKTTKPDKPDKVSKVNEGKVKNPNRTNNKPISNERSSSKEAGSKRVKDKEKVPATKEKENKTKEKQKVNDESGKKVKATKTDIKPSHIISVQNEEIKPKLEISSAKENVENKPKDIIEGDSINETDNTKEPTPTQKEHDEILNNAELKSISLESHVEQAPSPPSHNTSKHSDNSETMAKKVNEPQEEKEDKGKEVNPSTLAQTGTVAAAASSNPQPPVKRESTFTREDSQDSGNTVRPRTSLRPPSARPPSARPGAPRRRDKNVEIILQPNEQMKLAGINVKLEAFSDLNDDDGENLVIIENTNVNSELGEPMSNEENFTGQQQGHLVQQILETQKELVQDSILMSNQENRKQEKDLTNNVVARQSSARSVNDLRDTIHDQSKFINSLGKLMDFIPEDMDAMQLELIMWRDAFTQAAIELRREKSLTESFTEPMKNQLVQIEANIVEYVELIDASRAKILQNSDKILKLLTKQ